MSTFPLRIGTPDGLLAAYVFYSIDNLCSKGVIYFICMIISPLYKFFRELCCLLILYPICV